MTMFWRDGHYRNGYWVEGHWVNREDWDRFSLGNNTKQTTYKVEQTIFSSFTTPNAQCPICGDKVFFYQNSYGSKVWFDDLGSPWPIHGCFEDTKNTINTKTPPNKLDEQDFSNQSPKTLSLKSGKLRLGNINNNTVGLSDETPLIIKSSFSRGENSYIKALAYDPLKKEKNVFLIVSDHKAFSKNHICFFKQENFTTAKIDFFDIEKMQHGSVICHKTPDKKTYIYLTKFKQKNSENLQKIKAYKGKVSSLPKHTKIAIADWLYNNTMFDNHSLSVFSGLDDFEINQLVNDKLKCTHIPQSPVNTGLIDENAFNLLSDSIFCIKEVI